MDNKKYELLTNDTINVYGHTLYRIRALIDFNDVHKGDIGGYIEKEDNLSHFDNCWVYDDAIVFDNAEVFENAKIYGNAKVFGRARVFNNAKIYGNALISGNAKVFDDTRVYGNACVCENAIVYDNAELFGNIVLSNSAKLSNNAYISSNKDYLHIGPIGSRNDYSTFYNTKDKGIWVRCGCFNNSIDIFEERVKEVHKDSVYRKQYLDAIEYVKKYLK